MEFQSLLTAYPEIELGKPLKQLWSDCGGLYSARLRDENIVIKASRVPSSIKHSRIEQSSVAKNRKAWSYENELSFYQRHSDVLAEKKLTLQCFAVHQFNDSCYLALNNFESMGFRNLTCVNMSEIKAVISWLAKFHAHFLQINNQEGFERGGYWHLNTRPDEYIKMNDSMVKSCAHVINERLKNSDFQTIIHGDAKLANYAFDHENAVLGYDFQYVGTGIGLQDLMLFLVSTLNSDSLYANHELLLSDYFCVLHLETASYLSIEQQNSLESQWRALWPLVWCDYHRFLLGWKPDHERINDFLLMMSDRAIKSLC